MEHEDDRSRIVVAVAQCETVAGDVEANLDMIRWIASEAADRRGGPFGPPRDGAHRIRHRLRTIG